jgi:lipoprotein signal peptidase
VWKVMMAQFPYISMRLFGFGFVTEVTGEIGRLEAKVIFMHVEWLGVMAGAHCNFYDRLRFASIVNMGKISRLRSTY